MGADGSGRWHAHTKAYTVEECLTLDLRRLAREGSFVPRHTGMLRWLEGDQETARIRYTIRRAKNGLVLVLSYRWTPGGEGAGEDVQLPVSLETTVLHSGGLRWWGRCPLAVSGAVCGRRVAKLYLPPGGRHFGCRQCHRLTYTSCQESHVFDRLNRHIAKSLGWDVADVTRAVKHIGQGRT